MSYKCTNQFVSSKGRRYTYGEKISSFEFNSLLFGEQRQFTRYVDDESSSLSSNNNFSFTPTLFGNSDVYNNSSSFDNSSNSSFDGFGGGDSGGAGASGDW